MAKTRIGAAGALTILLATSCGGGSSATGPANQVVRERLASLAPAANLGHRGTGLTRAGHPFPENSLPSFREAMWEGADGIELDVELTADGKLVIMHDDTLDRTTTCSGCVSHLTLAEVRECRLLDGDGEPTADPPPTLDEVFAALPADALVNVELKVYGPTCLTAETGAEALAARAIDEVLALGVEDRVLYSSFSLDAAGAIKHVAPDLYSALLILVVDETTVERSVDAGLDAIHPFLVVDAATVEAILARGLQVNVWTVDGEALMREALDKGVTSIITDEPGLLREVLSTYG